MGTLLTCGIAESISFVINLLQVPGLVAGFKVWLRRIGAIESIERVWSNSSGRRAIKVGGAALAAFLLTLLISTVVRDDGPDEPKATPMPIMTVTVPPDQGPAEPGGDPDDGSPGGNDGSSGEKANDDHNDSSGSGDGGSGNASGGGSDDGSGGNGDGDDEPGPVDPADPGPDEPATGTPTNTVTTSPPTATPTNAEPTMVPASPTATDDPTPTTDVPPTDDPTSTPPPSETPTAPPTATSIVTIAPTPTPTRTPVNPTTVPETPTPTDPPLTPSATSTPIECEPSEPRVRCDQPELRRSDLRVTGTACVSLDEGFVTLRLQVENRSGAEMRLKGMATIDSEWNQSSRLGALDLEPCPLGRALAADGTPTIIVATVPLEMRAPSGANMVATYSVRFWTCDPFTAQRASWALPMTTCFPIAP